MKMINMLQRTLFLFAGLALVVSMSNCSDKKPRVKRADATDETVVEDPSKDVVIAQNNQAANANTNAVAAANSSNPFEGTWDVDANGSFFNWSFGYASKNGDKLEGKITDGSGAVIGDYVVFPNKTVELNVHAASVNSIVSFKVSNGGNQITIDDGGTKVSMTKGKSNTTAQNDGSVLASHIWTNINNPGDQREFMSVRKSSSGWNGDINIWSGGGFTSGTFSLTPGKLTITVSGSVDKFTYRLRNNNTTLDLTDPNGNMETYN